jgi:hypothetical protein
MLGVVKDLEVNKGIVTGKQTKTSQKGALLIWPRDFNVL